MSINASGQATVQFTHAGIEHTRTVDVDGCRSGSGSTSFDDAELGLHERKKIVGITH